ncbi:MAG: hypothetical protein SFU20_12765 [Chitinophagaceae bacterium]|nr:hypothetical protein [Chitinophagaceae bacterium]
MIQFDIKKAVLFILLGFHLTANAQTTLAAGDIAFTGYNADDNTVNGPSSNDDFSFILLKNITSGTSIYFTDFGWCSNTNAFQTPNPIREYADVKIELPENTVLSMQLVGANGLTI